MTHYRARFSDGHIIERKQSTRSYSHAYSWYGTAGGFARGTHGFAASETLAAKAMASDQRRQKPDRIKSQEIVAVIRPGTTEY